jgi:hypothetical protein
MFGYEEWAARVGIDSDNSGYIMSVLVVKIGRMVTLAFPEVTFNSQASRSGIAFADFLPERFSPEMTADYSYSGNAAFMRQPVVIVSGGAEQVGTFMFRTGSIPSMSITRIPSTSLIPAGSVTWRRFTVSWMTGI